MLYCVHHPQGYDKPTIQELSQHVIHQFAAHWKDLGALLGLRDYEIANIASDYRYQCVDSCREMLMLWLQNDASPTWGKLDDTIHSLMAILSYNPSGRFVHTVCNRAYYAYLWSVYMHVCLTNLLNIFHYHYIICMRGVITYPYQSICAM